MPLSQAGWTLTKSDRPGTALDFKSNKLEISASAHSAAAAEHPVPAAATEFECTIDKATDQGMSWGPAMALVWPNGNFVLVGVRDGKSAVLNVTTQDGEQILTPQADLYPSFGGNNAAFKLVSQPKITFINVEPKGTRVADRIGGQALEANFRQNGTGLQVRWRAELRDGSNYIRQTLTILSDTKTPLYGVELVDADVPDAETIGTCPGSPAVAKGFFFGVEMPGARNLITETGVRIGVSSKLEVTKQQPYSFTSVIGVCPEGQLRRGFLYYIERERARPSSPFLHYNCWYDLGFSVDEKSMMDVVTQFDAELVKKRGVKVMSYLVDDGWDTPGNGLWAENREKFPEGFAGLKSKMQKLDANLSIWFSPLGGYGGAEERTATARQMGLIPATSGLDFAQPKYKEWFQDRCIELMRQGGVNAFKWDRAGEGVSPHFMALLDIAHNLRKVNPQVFINVTVGTWPSPFWLNHVDTTWRNGSGDVGWAGVGDDREKWITFRDGYCHRLFVEQGPLYPLNSVMHHGIVHGRCFQGERVGKSGANLKNEARSYFGAGPSLQELYLTPSMMTPDAWDRVAESAKWNKAHAQILVDSHWVGGDPLKLEPYGYAAWSPKGAILTLRNPSDKPTTITLDAKSVFELPVGANNTVKLKAAYADQRVRALTLIAGRPVKVELEPFEVLVFD